MVWKHLKKPAILVASLALAVGIAPMVAFADEAAPEGADGGNQVAPELTAQADDNVIDSVIVNVSAPIAGSTTATAPDVTIPDGSNYSFDPGEANNGFFWSKSPIGEGYDSETTFQDGENYLIYVMLKPNSGYTFNAANAPTVNGGTLERAVEQDSSMFHFSVSVAAKAASSDTPAEDADEPAATDPESTEPAATEPAPAATEAETTTTETAANTDAAATTTTSNTTASTLPKTSDALPVALFGGIALMSGLVLAMAWRLRKN